MSRSLDVLFTPAEFEAFGRQDLAGVHCVVFDVLRATSTIVTAIANGASGVVAVAEIADALRFREEHPEALLAGERDGVRITKPLTGGIDFDLGNSPREFTRERVAGRLIVTTTTNGTRALRACARSERVWVGSFLNLQAIVHRMRQLDPPRVVLICSGTQEQAAYEDALAAGAMCESLWPMFADGAISDAATMARRLYLVEQGQLVSVFAATRNGSRLMAHPDLREDIPFCARLNTMSVTPRLGADAVIRDE